MLSLLKPRTYAAGGFGSAGDSSISFPEHDGIKCYAMVFGEIWLVVAGVPKPVRLKTGDCFLLPRGCPFHLTTDLGLEPVDYRTFLASRLEAGAASDDGTGSFIVGGHFALGGGPAEVLLGVLPPIVHIRKETDKAALRWSMERMMQELRDPAPGSVLVLQHLAQMMLVQALRAHLAEGVGGGVGWLFALADKQMGAAINAMHADPSYRWTLQDLAERAGMSRSTFALKFKATVGSSPMDYLTRWRMLVAGDRLTNSGDPISVISPALGYESESAFSTAFKRVMGCSPRQYGRRRTAMAPATDGVRAPRTEPMAA